MMDAMELRMQAMRGEGARAHRPEPRRRLPTTIGFAAVSDHDRMPARFFGRFTACAVAGLS
ncbi:hypothetical protein [Ancylobacter terrae]|uniref:hypothetical protein n=1 Tax=Ancylobacter sp. sgz301288 TaxID=3342077 RepID=UPI00385BA0C3